MGVCGCLMAVWHSKAFTNHKARLGMVSWAQGNEWRWYLYGIMCVTIYRMATIYRTCVGCWDVTACRYAYRSRFKHCRKEKGYLCRYLAFNSKPTTVLVVWEAVLPYPLHCATSLPLDQIVGNKIGMLWRNVVLWVRSLHKTSNRPK